MRRKVLSPAEKEALAEIVAKQDPALEPLMKRLGSILLSREEREALRGAVSDELAETGLDSDSEPNERGLFLEGLIERLWFYSVDCAEE